MNWTWLSPGDPAQRTGGYLWNARITSALAAQGQGVDVLPVPDGDLSAVPRDRWVVADGLAWPGLGDDDRRRLLARGPVAVVVHSRLSAEGDPGPPSDELDRWERATWQGVTTLVATSRFTAEELDDPRTVVVIPGTTPSPRAAGTDDRALLSVGTITPRKGHDRLLDLLDAGAPWTLRCAGAPRDEAWARSLRERGAPRVTWLGELDDDTLDAEYARAGLVVHAARYEAFGMALAEAVARGLPVLTTPAGVVDHLPPGAVQVCDASDFADALRALEDPSARRALADRAWAARTTLPDWPAQAALLAEALRG